MIATYIICKARGNPEIAPGFAFAMALLSARTLHTHKKNDPEVTHRDRFSFMIILLYYPI